MRRVMRGVGYRLLRLAEMGVRPELSLAGDRDLEWAWILANLPERPGRVLDFGPATSAIGAAAVFRGGEVRAIDLEAPPSHHALAGLETIRGDILTYPFGDQRFDTVINCSTVEHVGLPGRYGSPDKPDGDLSAMARLRELMSGPSARMLMTIPVGRDRVFIPEHRIYGAVRLPKLLTGFDTLRQKYFVKRSDGCWRETTRDVALAVEGSPSFYALGLFVLAPRAG